MIRQKLDVPLHLNTGATEESIEENAQPTPKSKNVLGRMVHNIVHVLNWNLWRQSSFVMRAMSASVVVKGLTMCFMILPQHIQDLGEQKTTSANAILYLGATDLLGRLAIGWLSDQLNKPIFRLMLHCSFVALEAVLGSHLTTSGRLWL